MNSLRDAIPAMRNADLQKLFPNGVPGIANVQARIENLSQEELALALPRQLPNSITTRFVHLG